jgi:hypothetical protein
MVLNKLLPHKFTDIYRILLTHTTGLTSITGASKLSLAIQNEDIKEL